MSALPLLALTFLASYLVGAVPFGYLVARARGVDILRHGSGNIGATNVSRVLGRKYGLLVFLLDAAKGALPVLAAGAWAPADPSLPPDLFRVTAGVAAFLGHLFPVYLRFRGGKGVATATGVIAVLLPGPTLAALLVWVVVFLPGRYVSLASLSAAAVLCGLRLVFTPAPWAWEHFVTTLFCLMATALVFARHHANIRRLVQGTENRFKESPAMLLFGKTLHVLSLGLWFGTSAFFTFVVGLSLFGTFEKEAAKPGPERPAWFPLWDRHDGPPPADSGLPDPMRKEQGTRAAGTAVGAIFPWYFGTQGVCALVALATALTWLGRKELVHRVRTVLLALALALVGVSWWLLREVDDLRKPRDDKTDVVLMSASPSPEQINEAAEARTRFIHWHLASLAVDLATLLLVTVTTALAAQLPARTEEPQPAVTRHATAPVTVPG